MKTFFSRFNWLFVIAIYSVVVGIVTLLPHAVPDELDFLVFARLCAQLFETHGFFESIFLIKNILGYGALYWIVYSWFVFHFFDPLFWMRLLALFVFILIPVLLCIKGRSNPNRILVLLLWLTFPMAWWTNKITGPDLMSLGFLSAGLVCFLYSRKPWRYVGLLLFGISVGVRLTVLFPITGLILGFVLADDELDWIAKFKQLGLFAVMGFLGFCLANPFFLLSPNVFFEELSKYQHSGFYPKNIRAFFYRSSLTWDKVESGSLLLWTIHWTVIPLLGVILKLFLKSKKWQWGMGLSLLFSLVMMMTSKFAYGWYLFPLGVIFIFGLNSIELNNGLLKKLLIGLLIFNALFQVPVIVKAILLKWDGAQVLSHKEEIFDDLRIFVQDKDIANIVDFSEFGFMDKAAMTYNGGQIVYISPKLSRLLNKYVVMVDSPIDGTQETVGMLSVYKANWLFNQGAAFIPENTLMILGERMIFNLDIHEFDRYFEGVDYEYLESHGVYFIYINP